MWFETKEGRWINLDDLSRLVLEREAGIYMMKFHQKGEEPIKTFNEIELTVKKAQELKQCLLKSQRTFVPMRESKTAHEIQSES